MADLLGLAGLTSSFGNGSDGTFNPALQVNNCTLTDGVNGGYYSANGNQLNPSTFNNANILAISLTPALGNTAAIQTSNAGGSVNIPWGGTIGTLVSPSTNITINKVATYFNSSNYGANANIQLAIYDQTAGKTLADYGVISAITLNQTAGWYTFTLPSNVDLPAGHNIMFNFYFGGYSGGTQPTVSVNTTGSSTASTVNYTGVGATTYVTFTAASLDGGPVVKQFTSINIPNGVVVTVDKRCQGLVMCSQGDATINGSINMDYLAALQDPRTTAGLASVDKANQLYYPIADTNNKVIVIGPGGSGGAGGSGGSSSSNANGGGGEWCPPLAQGGSGISGTWWGGGRGGGGGGGSVAFSASSSSQAQGGNGGDAAFTGTGTPGSGGSFVANSGNGQVVGNSGSAGGGGGGAVGSYGTASGAGTISGGSGGSSVGGGGGGGGAIGVSIYGPASYSGNAGGSTTQGAGGLILIIAGGNVTIGSTSILTANGGAGGAGGAGTCNFANANGYYGGVAGGGGGGGAGGGVIAVLYKGTLSNSGTLTVNGGAGGASGGASYTANNAVANNAGVGRPGNSGTTQLIQL